MCRTSFLARRSFLGALLLSLAFAGQARAQVTKLPPDLATLPDEIKTLKWQTIDPATLTPLEQSRSLLLLDHAIGELSANATSEADLMSAYIQKENLGSQFASTPPPPETKLLGISDAMKISVALLRGPMSSSYYATELSDASPSQLASYAAMYQRTVTRKWSEFDEARHQVRCMSAFLGNSQKLKDYDAWATAESARREQQYQQQQQAQAGAQPANAAAPPAQSQAQQQQNAAVPQALAAAEYQQQQPDQQQQQQQQQQDPSQSGTSTAYVPTAAVYGGYGAYGAYGATGAAAAGAYTGAAAGAAAGATAANDANAAQQQQKKQDAAAGAAAANHNNNNAGAAAANHNNNNAGASGASPYHASNSTWNRDSSYSSTAHASTEQRMNSFHGTGGGGAGRAGGGRR